MSAEGKKKRGISGLANAKNIPFRNGGSKCDLSTRIGHTNSKYGAGSKLVQAMGLGAMLPSFNTSQRLLDLTDNAMGRCTHPMLTA